MPLLTKLPSWAVQQHSQASGKEVELGDMICKSVLLLTLQVPNMAGRWGCWWTRPVHRSSQNHCQKGQQRARLEQWPLATRTWRDALNRRQTSFCCNDPLTAFFWSEEQVGEQRWGQNPQLDDADHAIGSMKMMKEMAFSTGHHRMSWDIWQQQITDQMSRCPTATSKSCCRSLWSALGSFWPCETCHWGRISWQMDCRWQLVVNDLACWSRQEKDWHCFWRAEWLTPSDEGQSNCIHWRCSCVVVSLSGSPVRCLQCDMWQSQSSLVFGQHFLMRKKHFWSDLDKSKQGQIAARWDKKLCQAFLCSNHVPCRGDEQCRPLWSMLVKQNSKGVTSFAKTD